VIMNLCTNAYQAIGNGNGEIAATCQPFEKYDALGGCEPDLPPGSYIVITVTDSGKGMSGETLERIFDPYFTTKEKGTGLGLPVARAIVHAHGGRMRVQSTECKGSTFYVFLPKLQAESAAAGTVGSAAWEKGENESVLLAEDDEINGPMLVLALTQLRYRVTLASDGMEAMTLFSRNPGAHDILVTDLTMPKMGGLELAQKIHALHPSIPVVLMTGYDEPLSLPHLHARGIQLFLRKPFTIVELSRALKSLGKAGA
jgi:CheY-like chemotaxis protein/anti-sigma regulatory factor (Ser/Thr protein kinase)